MKRPLSIFAICLLAVALSAGCKKSVDIVGKWKPADVTKQGLTLEFKADKSFSLYAGDHQLGGTYIFADGKLTMRFLNLTETPVPDGAKPISGSLSEEGATIRLTDFEANRGGADMSSGLTMVGRQDVKGSMLFARVKSPQ